VTSLFFLLVLIAVMVVIYTVSAVFLVRPYERGVVERLGRYHKMVDPGLRQVIPLIERLVKVDLRERIIDIPPQEAITSDNVSISVDAVVFYEVTDPRRLLYQVEDFFEALSKLAQTSLRDLVGDMTLDEALTSRERINAELREVLDEATDSWGTRVTRVEIQEVLPPADIKAAMHEQVKAERTRRAIVTEAEGKRDAAILEAEGEQNAIVQRANARRQEVILEAEGRATAIRELADAARARKILEGEGDAEATRQTFEAIHQGGPTTDLIAIKYLESLAEVANGQATKIFLPLDHSGLYGTVGGLSELLKPDPVSGTQNSAQEQAPAQDDEGNGGKEIPPPSLL